MDAESAKLSKSPVASTELTSHRLTMQLGSASSLLLTLLLLATFQSYASDLALVGARVYLSPSEPPLESGTILIHGALIQAVGPIAEIKVPSRTAVIDCKGLVVTAGFWNSHVHIPLPTLLHAEKLSSGQITFQLQQMLTRWGFTTVFCVKEFFKANHIDIPDVQSTAEATERVRQQIRDGANGIKIFTNSVEQNEILTVPLALAQAITTAAHRAGKPVSAHVSIDRGIEVAIQSGVDILAHTTPTDDPWTPTFAQRLIAAHMSLTPTLTLWDVESKKGNASQTDIEKRMSRAAKQLETFSRAGGQVLFGTDVGYIQEFQTSEEFTWMARAGMSYKEILASLITNPASASATQLTAGALRKDSMRIWWS